MILSQTLQETRQPLKVLSDILRAGRSPRTALFPHEWYSSPNIHFLTVLDFEELARRENWTIERRIFLAGNRELTALPNLLAEVAVFLIRK